MMANGRGRRWTPSSHAGLRPPRLNCRWGRQRFSLRRAPACLQTSRRLDPWSSRVDTRRSRVDAGSRRAEPLR